MFQFIGYNFFSDGDALNSAPSNATNINSATIENAVFDHLNVTQDASLTFSSTVPTDWTYQTIMDADFNDNLNAGNVDFLIEQISAIKIKRRIKGEFNWLTLTSIPINTIEDLTFIFNDLLNADLVTYEYALVPVLNDVEGNYIINEIFSQFNGIFIGDAHTTYKFLYDVNYGTNARNQQIGTFEPLGSQFPIIVQNGILSYNSGTVSATIMNDEFETIGVIDPIAITAKKEVIKDFLTNKKPKLLRDWVGNCWLVAVTNSPQITYKANSGMRIPNVQFEWKEIGISDNQQDLYNNGIINVSN